ncbi:MAG TPA: hypothetical protein VFP90_11560 [Gemmatimonadaceae bacterium]|jgi:hypothetical protein|nr:hypothetical protein [Gemmatimonadaceae bacterium]
MSHVRCTLLGVLSLAALTACVSEAPRSGVSGGEVAATPTPAGASAAPSTDTAPATEPTSTISTAAPAADAAAPASSGAAAASATAASDSTNPKLAAGRGKKDATSFAAAIRAGTRKEATWPTGPAPIAGALLPKNRIVAYYGNPHSKKMGVIGEYPEQQMLGMWDRTVAAWKAADPKTPVIPAIHLVTVVAQGAPGSDGMWRRWEDSSMIERTYKWAKSRNGILFLDIQASHSTLQKELPRLLPWLARPDVHLGVDPEFYMHYEREGARPSSKIGMMMASDVNYVIRTLDKLVADKKIPPKILVVHRFTKKMVPDAENIRPTSRVQVVMHMDGWGPPWLKFDSYRDYIVDHPVQYTGFKLFYHNDTKKGDALLTPRELLQLRPRLSYVQYQ